MAKKTQILSVISKASLAFILLLSLVIPSRTSSAITIPNTIKVATTDVPGNTNGPCDLSGALQAVFNATSNNADSTVDTCTAKPGQNVIIFNPLLTGSTIHLNGNDLPFIHDNTTIMGTGITIDGDGPGFDVHVFRLAPGASFTLVGIIIKDAYTAGNGPAIFDNNQGSINLVGVNLIDNHAGNGGGAIESNGNLTILASNLMVNKATGSTPGNGYGGAISFSGGGTLSISKSNFTGNVASGDGGGAIWIQSTYNTTSDIADTLFSGDVASTGGGAIYNASTSLDGTLKIERTAFTANLATSGSGGAIWNGINAKTDISDSSFNLNIAGTPVSAQMGGAIYNQSPNLTITRAAFIANSSPGGDGGALEDDRAGAILLSNSTLTGNTANGKGGAIMVTNSQSGGPQSMVTALNDTIAANSTVPPKSGSGGGIYADAGHAVSLGNTILDGNISENCAGPGAFTSQGHNLDSGVSCKLTAAGDLSANLNADLGGPAFNGGPFTSQLSMKLQPGSAAIDHGDNALCAAAPVSNKDQRGNDRPKDGDGSGGATCDIGAFEDDAAVSGYSSTPVQPGPINIGNTTQNVQISATFPVTDIGVADLQISSPSIGGANPGVFGVVSYPSTVSSSGGAQNVTLSCLSASQGSYSATLTLNTNDHANPSVTYNLACSVGASPVAGFGSSPNLPGPVVFPAVPKGSLSLTFITFKNNGTNTLTISSPVKSGVNPADFNFNALTFPINILANGAPVSVIFQCTPSDIGLRTATLGFTTNDPHQTSVSYNLMCMGNPPPPPALVNVSNLSGAPFLPTNFSAPFDSAISPDGQNAYVTYTDSVTNAGSIAILTKDPSIKKYLGINNASGFVTNANLNYPTEIAVTPDGKNVFAVGAYSDSLVMYTRDTTTGALSSPVTWTNSVGGVTNMTFPYGLVISPDGNFVYVSTRTSNAIVTFKRFHNTFVFGSSMVEPDLIFGSAGLAISPDGTSLYVAASHSTSDGNLLMYHRNTITGGLTKLTPTRSQNDCVDTPLFCPPGLDGMLSINKVVVSPDGSQVYTVAETSDSVLGFNRDPVTGYLHLNDGHFNNILGVTGLSVVDGIGISPDGSQVYTAAYIDKTVDVFTRDGASGYLNFDQKIADSGGTPPLAGARNVTVSPDGQIILVTAAVDNALVELAYASPVATLTNLAPASILAGGGNFTLTVHGKDFVNGASVYWNGSNSGINTTYVNSTTLTAVIPANRITSATSVPITVWNPDPGGKVSNNSLTFTVTTPAVAPIPSIDHLTPQGSTAGHAAFTMDVFGSGFLNGSTVKWNGSNRTTTFVDGGHLTALISLLDVAQPGLASVTVVTPFQPVASNPVAFAIAAPGQNPVPSITSLNPASVLSHGGASTPITLTVNGFNFVDGSVLKWNGAALPTHFVSSSQLTATIPASDLSATGSAVLTVFNPAPGGGESAPASLPIAQGNLPPLLAKVTSVTYANGQVTFTISGSYFLPTSIGQVHGVNQTTTYINANTIKISLPATSPFLVSETRITVINPAPDYSLSNPITIKHNYLPMAKK